MSSEQRVAVVTGAARGLGRAIAERLVADGYGVVYADLNAEGSRNAAVAVDPTGASALAVELDVRELESVQACLEAAVERWGHVDAWVNNAAVTLARTFFEIDPSEWDDLIATNLRGTYFGCRVAGLHMRERGAGRIVNLSSIAGQRGASVNGVHYAASKAGILAITRFAASELAPFGVTVNALAPAAIKGPSVAAVPADQVAGMVRTIPVGRLGQPEEVAALVAFLVSDDAGFVTGATYDINGGMLMR
jgi:3-oxoacyl-[acyl-carrier protein] reductase